MTKEELESLRDELEDKRSSLSEDLAVKRSELKVLETELEKSKAKVIDIVGSDEPEEVNEYLEKLEKSIETDLAKLNEMEN